MTIETIRRTTASTAWRWSSTTAGAGWESSPTWATLSRVGNSRRFARRNPDRATTILTCSTTVLSAVSQTPHRGRRTPVEQRGGLAASRFWLSPPMGLPGPSLRAQQSPGACLARPSSPAWFQASVARRQPVPGRRDAGSVASCDADRTPAPQCDNPRRATSLARFAGPTPDGASAGISAG